MTPSPKVRIMDHTKFDTDVGARTLSTVLVRTFIQKHTEEIYRSSYTSLFTFSRRQINPESSFGILYHRIVPYTAKHFDNLSKGIPAFQSLGKQLACKSLASNLSIEYVIHSIIFLKESMYKTIKVNNMFRLLSSKNVMTIGYAINTLYDVLISTIATSYHSEQRAHAEANIINLKKLHTVLTRSEKKLTYQLQLIQSITRSAATIIFVAGEDGNIRYLNPEAKRVFGYTLKELQGKSLHEVIHYQYPDGTPFPISECPLGHVFADGKPVREYEGVFFRKDGKRVDAICSNMPIVENGKILGEVLTIQNITKQKKAEQRIILSEKKFKELSDSMPQLVWTADSRGMVDYYNAKKSQFSRTRVDRSMYHLKLLYHEQDRHRTIKKWKRAIEKKEIFEIEHRIKVKGGAYKWFLSRATPIKDPSNHVVTWYGTTTDIDQMKKYEQALRVSEAKFKAMYESNILGIYISTIQGNIIDANEAFLKLIGWDEAELRSGKLSWDMLSPPRYIESEMRVLADLKKTRYTTTYEREYLRKDISCVPVLVGRVLFDYSKKHIISFVLDITERKKLEERKDEFIGIASHELKTPLTSVKGYIQILQRLISKKEYAHMATYLSKANMYIDRLNGLVADLLDVSKIQSGKLAFTISTFRFDELIRESIDSIQPTSLQHTIHFFGDGNYQIRGDKHRLEQVITNLLTNAIKYSPQSHTILVRSKKKKYTIQLSVTDFGIGIAPDKQKKIFERFYRVQNDDKTFSGLGIGLYISHEIIRRHGGTLSVTSIEGKKTVFTFTLPLEEEG